MDFLPALRVVYSPISYEKQLREMQSFSQEKRRLRGNIFMFCSCLKGGCSEVQVCLFSHVINDRMRVKSLKLHQVRFRLDVRKIVFMEQAVPVAESHLWKCSTHVDMALEDVVQR